MPGVPRSTRVQGREEEEEETSEREREIRLERRKDSFVLVFYLRFIRRERPGEEVPSCHASSSSSFVRLRVRAQVCKKKEEQRNPCSTDQTQQVCLLVRKAAKARKRNQSKTYQSTELSSDLPGGFHEFLRVLRGQSSREGGVTRITRQKQKEETEEEGNSRRRGFVIGAELRKKKRRGF